MNQKAHLVGGLILATAAMLAGCPPLTASLIVFGGLFCDLDIVDIPVSSQGVHRRLLHNVFVAGAVGVLSYWVPFLMYWLMGMCLHIAMDMFSSSPVYVLWPVPHRGNQIGIGGWGVSNDSIGSFPVGCLVALLFSAGYLVGTDHFWEVVELGKRLLEYIFP
ncbi:MAG: metal-dependent hydrolase [Theionarchaea archaeon]|nr:metal-dependent hydrolase [Theionarchaea archaeon]